MFERGKRLERCPLNVGQLEYVDHYSKCPEESLLAALTSGV
jgi:hypothetical protein